MAELLQGLITKAFPYAGNRQILPAWVFLTFLTALLVSLPLSAAQTSQLVLRFPDGTPTGLGSTCFEEQECTLSSAEVTKVCTQEGIYSLLFTSHEADSSTSKFPEKDAHTVNWNSQQYCNAACTGQNVAFSTTAQFCCGAHRSRDCGFRYGNEVCGDTSPNTWEYMNLQNNIGDIYQFLCANASIVSNGQDFFTCGDPSAFVTKHPTQDKLPITRGSITHDYVCAELSPDDPNSLKTWIECHGNQDILTRKAGSSADHGYAVQFGTLLLKKLSASENLEVKQAFNFNPERGIITLTIKPSWRGTDGLSHTFLEYRVDDDNLIRILKQADATIQCQYRNNASFHSPASITAAGWNIGESHTVKMTYDTASGKVSCTVDETSTEAGSAGKLNNGGTLLLNAARLGAMPGQAELTVRTTDILNPSTLYCDTTGKLLQNLDPPADRVLTNERLTCEAAKLTWTGTKCCSEDDDKPHEFYNDPDPRAGTPPSASSSSSSPTTSSSSPSSSPGSSSQTSSTTPPTGKGTATEGIFFPTGNAVLDLQPSRPGPALLSITGMQTATCPDVTPPSCSDGTLVPQFDQNRCIISLTCNPWKTSTPGTCWNSTYFRNGQSAPGTGEKLIAAQGRWLACLNTSHPVDASLLDLKDTHTNARLITPVDVCTLAVNLSGIPGNNKMCSYRSRTWIPPTGTVQHRLSAHPFNSSDKECCPRTACWKGDTCQADQTEESEFVTFNHFRCLNGTWINQTPFLSSDGKEKGFCPRDNQCLVNNRGSKANIDVPTAFFSNDPSQQPTCIKQGQYILNQICEAKPGIQGANTTPTGLSKVEWKSRSLLIALQLAELGETVSPSDYAIFCGSFEDVLNFVDYQPQVSTSTVRNYLTTPCLINGIAAPCVNSFCAMRFAGTNVAIGTSTNVPISDPLKSFLISLNQPATKCKGFGSPEDGAYHPCGDGISYNNVTASIIKIPATQTLPVTTVSQLLERRMPASILAPMNVLSTFMDRPLLKTRQEFFNATTMFSELYIAKKAGKNYFGILERERYSDIPVDYVAVSYNGFPVIDPITGKKPCDMITSKIQPSELLETDCSFDSNNNLRYVAFSKPPAGTTSSPLREAWKDLTAKLR